MTTARVTAAEAAAFLGVTRATLYAYVSRGKLRSLPGPGKSHSYAMDELERLRTDAEARRGHGPAAGSALMWGAPVLSTRLVSIDGRGPSYRGVAAVDLVRAGTTFETAAEHLWHGPQRATLPLEASESQLDWSQQSSSELVERSFVRGRVEPMQRLLLLLPALAVGDAARFVHSAPSELDRARRIILTMVGALARTRGTRVYERVSRARGVARSLCIALGGRTTSPNVAALDQALVLVADHELNPSTFAARIAAGTGADLYACLVAALATLSGPLHGGASRRIEALLREVRSERRASSVILARMRRGEVIPGFGHPLYPEGDPRARVLLDTARALSPKDAGLRKLLAIVRAMDRLAGEYATVDVGLVALRLALGLSAGSAQAIFAVGRSAGWVAHVLEQRESGVPLRPRAQYQAD